MNLIALLIGLAIERLATQLFHWRRMRWLEQIIDAGFERARRLQWLPAFGAVILLVVLLALPVLIVIVSLGDALLGFPYLFLAIVVLFFSLGPKDIGEDVDDYCDALRDGDEEATRRTAKSLVESDLPGDPAAAVREVESAVFVQANNRLFAVIFWFVVLGPLGPLGAWAYRVTDLIRRRAVFNAGRDEAGDAEWAATRDAAVELHGWLAWIPARLTAIGYAIAGHFDGALAAWRSPAEHAATTWERNQQLLARVGQGAMSLVDTDDETIEERGIRGARTAKELTFRLLIIWTVVIAALTLYGWVA
jgi:AmpE protein